MSHTRAWRNFKRMQDLTVVTALLVYAAATVHALGVLPGTTTQVLLWTVGWPALYLLPSLVLPLLVAPFRRGLSRYVWMSFKAGFGQTPASILTSVALLLGAALFVYSQVAATAASGHYQVNVFSAYAAGIGILAAQAALVRTIERDPAVRPLIEDAS